MSFFLIVILSLHLIVLLMNLKIGNSFIWKKSNLSPKVKYRLPFKLLTLRSANRIEERLLETEDCHVSRAQVSNNVLFEFAHEIVPVSITGSYIKKWAEELTNSGQAIQIENIENGVSLKFNSFPGSYLKIYAESVSTEDENSSKSKSMSIISQFVNNGSNDRVKSLLTFSISNMLESFINQINFLLSDTSSPYNNDNNNIDSTSISAKEEEEASAAYSNYIKTLNNDNEYVNDNEIKGEDMPAIDEKTAQQYVKNAWVETQVSTPPPVSISLPNNNINSIQNPNKYDNNIKDAKQLSPKISILHQWQNIITSADKKSVIKYIQSWAANKYSMKGTGIEISDISEGIEISFAIMTSDEKHSSEDNKNRFFKIETKDIDSITCLTSNKYEFLINLSKESNENEFLLKKVVDNLENMITNEIKSLKVSYEENPSAFSSIPSGTMNTQVFKHKEDNKEEEDIFVDEFQYSDIIKRASSASIPSSPFNRNNREVPLQQQMHQQGQRDPRLLEKAMDIGLKLDAFVNKGLEDQAIDELNKMVSNSRSKGFIEVVKNSFSFSNNSSSTQSNSNSNSRNNNTINSDGNISRDLFLEGSKVSLAKTLQTMLEKPNPFDTDDLSLPPTTLPMFNIKPNTKVNFKKEENNETISLGFKFDENSLDIFQGPPYTNPKANTGIPGIENFSEGKNSPSIFSARTPPESSLAAQAMKFQPPNKNTVKLDRQRFLLLITDLSRNSPDVHEIILESFKDLLLSENLLYLLNQANISTSFIEFGEENIIRPLLAKVTNYAFTLNTQLVELIQQESIRHLTTIHEICDISRKFQSSDELLFLDALDLLKPKFDTDLLSYLKYAIEEEMNNVRLKGSDPVMMPSPWLTILRVIEQGVLAEFEVRYDRLLEPLLLVIRFEDVNIRRTLFSRFVNVTAPLDLLYMRELAMNMANSIIDSDKNNKNSGMLNDLNGFSGADDLNLVDKMHQLREDVCLYLSDEYIDDKVSAFKALAKEQGVSIVMQHRNPMKRGDNDEEDGNSGISLVNSDSSAGNRISSRSTESGIAKDINGYAFEDGGDEKYQQEQNQLRPSILDRSFK